MTDVSVTLTQGSNISALAYVPWSFLGSNRSNERVKIYMPAHSGSVEDIIHCTEEGGIHEIRRGFSMPPSDKLIPALIMETPYPSQTPRDYLIKLIKDVDTDATPTNVGLGLDLRTLNAILRSFHAHHLSFKSYPHQGISQASPLILTTAFKSPDIGKDTSLLASAFRNYPFNFKIYAGDFPSHEKEPPSAYDGIIIIAAAENADDNDLVDRIGKMLNPEKIVVTREELVGAKKVFAKPTL